jgi:hypothetical protein
MAHKRSDAGLIRYRKFAMLRTNLKLLRKQASIKFNERLLISSANGEH